MGQERSLFRVEVSKAAREQEHRKGVLAGRQEIKANLLTLLDGKLKPLLVELSRLHPEVLEERKHELNGEERLYWYLGYISALKDARHMTQKGSWPLEAADPSTIDLAEED